MQRQIRGVHVRSACNLSALNPDPDVTVTTLKHTLDTLLCTVHNLIWCSLIIVSIKLHYHTNLVSIVRLQHYSSASAQVLHDNLSKFTSKIMSLLVPARIIVCPQRSGMIIALAVSTPSQTNRVCIHTCIKSYNTVKSQGIR